jgi:uncharacterized protein (DUF58 family)
MPREETISHPLPFQIRRRRVSLRPTSYGCVFLVLVSAMLLGSINYGNNLGFLLTFLIGSIGFVSLIHTHRNLSGLNFYTYRADPVFAGETAVFELSVDTGRWPRYAVQFKLGATDAPAEGVDWVRGSNARVRLSVPAAQRGSLRPTPLTVFSDYPLGLFRAVCRRPVDMQCLVFPRPLPGKSALTPDASDGSADQTHRRAGTDDFRSLRPYAVGDALQHISWKASSRGQGLFTKVFSGFGGTAVIVDWDACEETERERRLSLMCYWVLQAHRQQLHFGLKLPGTRVSPDTGAAHTQRCLEILARFPHQAQ